MILINIQDDIIRLNSLGVLSRLLVDKTTQKNIMWATDAYSQYGDRYSRDSEITSDLIVNTGVIKTRARKEFEQQSIRTRQRAEVFTPLWICNLMNNHADEIWFGRKDVFNVNSMPTDHVEFDDSHTWQDYVLSKRLEITCGEAPYLVSRYDVSSGELIPIENRIGILDRKLRVINENVTDESSWIEWVIKAFQSTYGYEFQGDNLFIARINFVISFEEYLKHKWNRIPTAKEWRIIENIVCWNLWQMDGLTGTIPFKKAQESNKQIDMFELMGMIDANQTEEESQPLCRIFDWRSNKSLTYRSIKESNL